MLHGHAVDVARKTQRQIGHVHQAIVEAAETLDGGGAFMAEHAVHLVHPELIVPGGHRGVGGEDAVFTHVGGIAVLGVAKRDTGRGDPPSSRW